MITARLLFLFKRRVVLSVSTVTLTLEFGQSLYLSTDAGSVVAVLNSTDLPNDASLVAGIFG
jgi:hypothetical protein